MPPFVVRDYRTSDERIPFQEWLMALQDRQGRARIKARIDRLLLGNFGDCKPVGDGVFELRLYSGPGYRIYFGMERRAFVILLIGGDKQTQRSDILKAQEYWRDYRRRKQS